jgi:hypothetical protein
MIPKVKKGNPLFWVMLVLAVFLGLAAIIVLSASYAQAPRQQQQTLLVPDTIQIKETIENPNIRDGILKLDWPVSLRIGEKSVLTLAVNAKHEQEQDPESSIDSQEFENPGEVQAEENQSANIVSVARLEIEGMDAFPGEKRSPIVPGQQQTFQWEIRPDKAGAYRGKVWLHLEFVPKQGGEVQRVLVLARPIEINVIPVKGMSLTAARWVGAACLVGSIILIALLLSSQ